MAIAASEAPQAAIAGPSVDTVCWHVHRLLRATAPAGETPEQEEARANAIGAMYEALAPADAWQAGRACRLIEMDFMLQTALRALNDAADTPEKLPKLRASALAAGRELRQYEARYEKSRAAAIRAAEASPAGGGKPASLPSAAAPAPSAPPADRALGPDRKNGDRDRTDGAPALARPGQAAPIPPPSAGNAARPPGLGATPPHPEHYQRLPEVDAFMQRARAQLEADIDTNIPLSETFTKIARSG